MNERIIEIATADGRMETFVTHPEQGGPFAPVVLYMDIWGVREELYDLARRIGTVGYYCLVPDLYYRQGKVRSTWIDKDGRRISLNRLSQAEQNEVLAPARLLTDAMVVADTGAIIRNLGSGAEPVDPTTFGSVGFCMGGRHILQVGIAYPGRFKANASLHGTALISDRPDSPHLHVGELEGELYCGYAEIDEHAPLPMVERLGGLLAPCRVKYTSVIHKGAEHGYSLPDRDIFHKQAANRDWELILAMFRRQIPPRS